MIVVPVNLHAQWTHEIHRYLEHGTFDVFPYQLGTGSRLRFWEDIWPRSVYSKDGDNRKILLATVNVSNVVFITAYNTLTFSAARLSPPIWLMGSKSLLEMKISRIYSTTIKRFPQSTSRPPTVTTGPWYYPMRDPTRGSPTTSCTLCAKSI